MITTRVNEFFHYLRENAGMIFVMVIILYTVVQSTSFQTWVIKLWDRSTLLLSSSSSSQQQQQQQQQTSLTHEERMQDMMRVRMKQQEETAQRSKEAAKLRKVQQDAERKRKNEAALLLQKNKEYQTRDGVTTGSGEGYNPLQPWSSSSTTGGGYRPTRRNPRRG